MRLITDIYERAVGVRAVRWPRLRPLCRAIAISSSVALSIASAGCGSGGASTAATKLPAIAFGSPSIIGNRASGKAPTIPARYTCDGKDTMPPLGWGAVPPGTAELALFIFKVERSVPNSTGGGVAVSVEWAVAGLSPKIHAISAGKLPHGAVAASKRYSICPPKGKSGIYIFQISAVSRRFAVRPHFNAVQLFKESEGSTVASGTFTSTYKRT
jgi:phosphatidylethanolamine-binding protein (PEBP) family uncharacterized protein